MQGLQFKPEWLCQDAFNLKIENQYDLISSNGLNIYQPSIEKNKNLFKGLYNALKPKGKLVCSFLTPPPNNDKACEWNMSEINQEHLLLQKIIFQDVINAAWANFMTSNEMTTLLTSIGFKDIRIEQDLANMFPTIVGYK